MSTTEKPYSVNFWGSKPGTDDDCWTGIDFADRHEAMAAFHARPLDLVSYGSAVSTAWIEIDGPDMHAERENPDYDREAEVDDADDWRREFRMQNAMAFGVAGWNDCN